MRANQVNAEESIEKMNNLEPDISSLKREKFNNPLISVVIPLYNEENTIRNIIERIPNHRRYEILLVDDGSTDNSLNNIQDINNRDLKIIKHKNNQGYGAAVLSGLKNATGDIIVTMDSDGQHNPEEISTIIKPILNQKADLTVGSRYLGNANYRVPLYIRTGEYFIRLCLKLLFKQRVYNNQSGFRAFSSSSLKIFNNIKQTKFGFCTETLFEAAHSRLKISEIPVNMNMRKYGSTNINLLKVAISISSCIINYFLKRIKLTKFNTNRISTNNLLLKQSSVSKHPYEKELALKDNYIYPNLKIGLIIPAFNEELNIRKVLLSIPKNLSNELKILVIDDGSTDRTYEIAKSLNCIVLKHKQNKGNGAATITGLNYCRENDYEVAVILDADGQHNPKHITDFINPIIENRVDFTIGNRFKYPYKMNTNKKLCSKLITAFYFVILRKKISDPTNGYRALSSKIFKNVNFDSNYSITQEMLYKIVPFYKFKQIPILVNERKNGESFIKLNKYFFKMVLMLLKYYIFPKFRKITRKIFNKKIRRIITSSVLKT